MTDRFSDYGKWKAGDTCEYAGFTVKPKKDMHGWKETHGWVVTDGGIVNVLPAATWAKSMDEALGLIDCFLAVDQDGQKFWHLLRAIKRMSS